MLVLTTPSAFANVLFSENFNGVPDGWVVTPDPGDPNNPAWSVTTDGFLNVTGASFDQSYAISHPTEEGPRANQNTSLITPPINAVGSTNLRLTFSEKFVGYAEPFIPGLTNWAQGILSVSVDGGTTWEDVYARQGAPSTQSKETVIMLPQAAGQEDVRLRWRYAGGNGAPWNFGLPWNYWAIDSVVLEGTADAPFVAGESYLIDGQEFPAAGLFANMTSALEALKARGVSGTGEIIFAFGANYNGAEPESIDIDKIGGLTPEGGRTLVFRPAASVTDVVTTFPDDHHLRIRSGNVILDGRAGGVGTGRNWTLHAKDCVVRVLGTANELPLPEVSLRNLNVLSLGKGNPWTSSTLDIRAGFPEMVGLRIHDNVIGSVGGESGNSFVPNGIAVQGGRHPNTGLEIRNNRILNTTGRGIWLQGSYMSALIQENLVTTDTPLKGADHTSSQRFIGIVFDTRTSPGTILRGNRIEGIEIDQFLHGVTGILLLRGNWTAEQNWSNDPVRVYNNTVLLGDRPGHDAPWPTITGISVEQSPGALFEIDHNTVYLTGETAAFSTTSSRAFSNNSATALKVRNNNFYNARSNGEDATGTHYAIQIDNGSFLDIGFNNYRADGVGGILGNTANGAQAGVRATIAEWLDAVSADRESVSVTPAFIDTEATPANLNLDPDTLTPLESGGRPLAHVTVDIEGVARFPQMGYPEHPGFEARAPDIGAYEFGGQSVDVVPPTIMIEQLQKIVVSATFTLPPAVITDRTGVDTSPGSLPRLYYKRATNADELNDNTNLTNGWKYVEAAVTDTDTYAFTMDFSLLSGGGGISVGDSIQYFIIAQDISPAVNLSTLPYLGLNDAPDTVALTSLQFPLSGTPYSLDVTPSYEGVYSAGVGGNFETIQEAVTAIVAGVLSGDTIIELTDTSYLESVEMFPLAHNGHFLTIRPAEDVEIVWTSQSIFSGPPLSIRGAAHVRIEGERRLALVQTSNSSRALSIDHAAAAGSPSWMTDGVRPSYITVTGVNLSSAYNTATTGFDYGHCTYGIVASGDQLNFIDNIISRVGVGILVVGADNAIIGNTIGAELPQNYVSGGGVMVGGARTTISGNHIFNIFTTVVGGGSWSESRVLVEHPIQYTHKGAIAISSHGEEARITGNLVSGYGSIYGGGGHDAGIVVNGNRALLANNIVLNEAAPMLAAGNHTLRSRAMEIFGQDVKVWHNSVHLLGDFDGVPPHRYDSACLAVYRSHSSSYLLPDSARINLRNNLFRNGIVFPDEWLDEGVLGEAEPDRFGSVRVLHVVDYYDFDPEALDIGNLFDVADNNLYYITSAYESALFGSVDIGALARYGRDMPHGSLNGLLNWVGENANFDTLPEWQMEFEVDSNSITADPVTVSDTDLTPLGPSPLLQAAVPLEDVATDFHGNTRDLSAPTIGAIEEPFLTSEPPSILSFEVFDGSPVTKVSTLLSVTAEDDGGPEFLTYLWTLLEGPEGAGVDFSPNNELGTAQTTATFSAPGQYTLRARATDAENQFDEATLMLEVVATVSGLRIEPADDTVSFGAFFFYSAYRVDQFGQDVLPAHEPSALWSINGGGEIHEESGGFFASMPPEGIYTVTASANGLQGQTTLTVSLSPNQIFFVQQPSDVIVDEGDTAPLEAEVYGRSDLTFQWYAGSIGDTSSPLGDPVTVVAPEPDAAHSAQSSVQSPPIFGPASFWVRVTDEEDNSISSNEAYVSLQGDQPIQNFAEWIAAYAMDGPESAPDRSYIGDGVPNLVKYALGLDPLEPVINGEGLPTLTIEDHVNWQGGGNDPEPHAVYRFRRNMERMDIHISVECSSEITGGEILMDDFDPDYPMENSLEPRRAMIPIADAQRMFFRLRVQQW